MININVLLREPINQPLKETSMVNTLEGIYALLKCEVFQNIFIGQGVVVLIDEEGLLKENPQKNFFSEKYGWIVGNAVFCGMKNGELISITEAQKKYVSEYLGFPIVK